MRKIIPIIISFYLLLVLSAESSSSIPDISSKNIVPIPVQPQKKLIPTNPVQVKLSLKERLLEKWYKKRMAHTISEEEKKKKIILLGKLSLWSAIAGIALVVVPMGFILTVFLIPVSLILGMISLHRRKNFANKSEINKWPALVGVIISSLTILTVAVFLLSYIGYGG